MSSVYHQLDTWLETINDPTILVFTTTITEELVTFLSDEYNFEVTLRLVDDLPLQLKIQAVKDRFQRIKLLIGELFQRLILNFHLGNSTDPWRRVQFQYNKYGKPLLPDAKFQFNSSSSNSIISIVVEHSTTNSPVGVDLSHSKQRISPSLFLEDFEPIFAPSELEYLRAYDNDSQRYFVFNHLWTLKEAYTKLLGSGLNIELSDFFFKFGDTSFNVENYYKRIQLKEENGISEYNVEWYTKVQVDNEGLIAKKDRFVHSLERNSESYCHSAILDRGDADLLPVIITIINQNRSSKLRSFEVSFLDILKQIQ